LSVLAHADDDAQTPLTGPIWLAALLLAAVGVMCLRRTFAARDGGPKA
jgi:hypothetical protein